MELEKRDGRTTFVNTRDGATHGSEADAMFRSRADTYMDDPMVGDWEAQKTERESSLLQVFTLFDLDGNGVLDPKELLALGRMRRELGHRQDLWTNEKNEELIQELP